MSLYQGSNEERKIIGIQPKIIKLPYYSKVSLQSLGTLGVNIIMQDPS